MSKDTRPEDEEELDGGMSTSESKIRGLPSFLLLLTFFTISVAVILLTPRLTQAPPPNMGLHTHPALFPTIALLMMATASGILTVRCLLRSWPFEIGPSIVKALRFGRLPVAFSVIYLIYFVAVAKIGYMLATLILTVLVLALAKVDRKNFLVGALLLPAICYVVFIYLLEIWFPAPEWF